MPTALKTTTAGFTIDEPSLFLIGTTAYETRGGITVTPTITTRQIEVDGVSQAVDGLDFVEGTSCTVSLTILSVPDALIPTLMWQDGPTGALPDLIYQTPNVQRLLPMTAYLDNLSVMRRRRDGNFLGIRIPRALLTSFVPSAGTNGDGTYQLSFESRAPIANPYADHWSFVRTDDPISGVTI